MLGAGRSRANIALTRSSPVVRSTIVDYLRQMYVTGSALRRAPVALNHGDPAGAESRPENPSGEENARARSGRLPSLNGIASWRANAFAGLAHNAHMTEMLKRHSGGYCYASYVSFALNLMIPARLLSCLS